MILELLSMEVGGEVKICSTLVRNQMGFLTTTLHIKQAHKGPVLRITLAVYNSLSSRYLLLTLVHVRAFGGHLWHFHLGEPWLVITEFHS